MKVSDLVTRFEYYAQHNKNLLHLADSGTDIAFVHLEAEELQQVVKSGLKFPCLLLQTPEVEKSGAYDSITEDFAFTYVVIMPLGDYRKDQVIDRCKAISDQIFNRMFADVQANILPSLTSGTNEGIVGPMVDKLYGWGKSLSAIDGYDGRVDKGQWDDMSGDAVGMKGEKLPFKLN